VPHDVVGGRAEHQQVERAAPLHAHDEQVGSFLRRDLENAQWLAREVRATPDWRVLAPVPLQTVCVRHEPRLSDASCAPCGACCRQGFDRVELRPRDVVKRKHLKLVSEDRFGEYLARPKGLCVALTQGEAGYRCTIYRDRPRACAEFEVGGDPCLSARRRVGLSA